MEQNCSSLFFVYAIGILSTLFVAGIFFVIFFKKPLLLNWSKHIFIFSIIFYFAQILTFQLLKLYTFKYYTDFAVWLELFSHIIDGRGIISTLHQTSIGYGDARSYLALHFVPLIYVIALPLYVLKNYPVYLIVLQTLILTSSVIPIYLFARNVFYDKKIGYMFAASFLFYPTIQYINLYDFEFLRISIPLLLFCFYFLSEKKYTAYYIFFVLAILVREEVSLTTFWVGIYAFLFIKERRVGVITAAVSIAYFLLITKTVMPYFYGNSASVHHSVAFGSFSHLGGSPSQVLVNLILHPWVIVFNLLNQIKIANFLMYVLPLLFTPFFSPMVFFISTGNLLLNLLSISTSHYSYILYYLSPSIPFLFLSSIKGVKNIEMRIILFLKRKNILTVNINNKNITYTLVCSIFLACISSNFFFGPSSFSLQFWFKDYKLAPYKTHNFHYSQYIITEHHRKSFQFFPLIPDDAIVSAEHFFLPYLYRKKSLMQFPVFEGADYVLIDKKHPVKFGTIGVDPIEARKNPQKYYDLVEKDTKNWELIKKDDGVFLFKKRQWN